MNDLISRNEAIDALLEKGQKSRRYKLGEIWELNFDEIREALATVPSAEPEQKLDEWCTDCKEYDQEKHCCHRWNRVIRTTVDEMKQQKYGRWIPVTERLPEIKEHHVSDACIVCLKNGGMTFAELQENIFGQIGWDIEREDDYHLLRKVVAWMLLPKPYQEEKDASND